MLGNAYDAFIEYSLTFPRRSLRVTTLKIAISELKKRLENKWLFKQKGNNSEVDFHVDFELKNKILNMLMIKTFAIGLKKIADAFEKRAIDLFKST